MAVKETLRRLIPALAWLRLQAWRNRAFGFLWYGHSFRYARAWSEPERPKDASDAPAMEQDNRLWAGGVLR